MEITRKLLTLVLCTCLLSQQIMAGSLLGNKEQIKIGSSEYYLMNPDEAQLIRIQLWGDVQQPGFYNIPTGTTLRSMLGYVGGPMGIPDSTKITISRPGEGKAIEEDPDLYRIKVVDLMASRQWSSFELRPGDVVYMDGDKAKQSEGGFMDVLKDIIFVLGFVTTTVSTYLLIQQISRTS